MQMTVEVPPAFHIFYATGWARPVLKYRLLHADGSPHDHVSSKQFPTSQTCSPWAGQGLAEHLPGWGPQWGALHGTSPSAVCMHAGVARGGDAEHAQPRAAQRRPLAQRSDSCSSGGTRARAGPAAAGVHGLRRRERRGGPARRFWVGLPRALPRRLPPAARLRAALPARARRALHAGRVFLVITLILQPPLLPACTCRSMPSPAVCAPQGRAAMLKAALLLSSALTPLQ
jgi:hypothetical protein